MNKQSLGQKLRELRDKLDLSLRECASQIGVSAPFLSDIELGRRMPSDDVLIRMAKVLKIDLTDLRQYDMREPMAELKRMMDTDPRVGFAFRTAVEQMKEGRLTPEEVVDRLTKSSKKG